MSSTRLAVIATRLFCDRQGEECRRGKVTRTYLDDNFVLLTEEQLLPVILLGDHREPALLLSELSRSDGGELMVSRDDRTRDVGSVDGGGRPDIVR